MLFYFSSSPRLQCSARAGPHQALCFSGPRRRQCNRLAGDGTSSVANRVQHLSHHNEPRAWCSGGDSAPDPSGTHGQPDPRLGRKLGRRHGWWACGEINARRRHLRRVGQRRSDPRRGSCRPYALRRHGPTRTSTRLVSRVCDRLRRGAGNRHRVGEPRLHPVPRCSAVLRCGAGNQLALSLRSSRSGDHSEPWQGHLAPPLRLDLRCRERAGARGPVRALPQQSPSRCRFARTATMLVRMLDPAMRCKSCLASEPVHLHTRADGANAPPTIYRA